ncbi:MAG: choice-of-anchor J domain-containing protein, partial [Lachnospiraceae bacterium]|nr:choice-of-anchor J domain-containing protein [Lachnospiraceae bacterium]
MRRKMKRFLTSALAFTMAFTMAGSNVVAAGLEGRQSLQVTEETELAEEVATVENETPEEELNSEELTLPEETAPTSNPKEVVERAYMLFEDFENDFPDDWEQSSTTNEISWQILPDDYNFVPPWPVETDEHDIVYSSLYTDVRLSYGNLITREMNLSGADSATLSFRYRNPEAHDDYDIFNVFYAVGDSDHYEDLMDVLTPHDEWTQVTINIPESMCVQRVKFVFSVTMQWGWGVALDDISVETHVTPTNTYAEGFENGGALPQGWTFLDADGDNNNWYVGRPGAQQVHGGEYILASASYSWTQETPLTPDNWAITPAITLPQNAGLSFWIKATDVRYHNEKIGVYIGSAPTLESMVALDPEIISPTTYQQYAYDLSAYAGQTVYIGFRHYDVSDEFQINLDDVEIFINETYYSVTYDANGGSGSMTDGNAYVLGYNFCVPENTFTAPEGYFFTGWNDRRNGKGTTYLPGDRLNITDNITLYAQWHKNFESFDVDFEQGMPEYWTIETTAPDFTWTYYDDIISTHSDWGNDEAMLISPRLNLADLFIATLRFSYRNNGTAAYGGQDLNIYYHVGDGPWIPLDFEQEETNAQLITYEIQLPAYALKDNVQICFESIENGERDNALASASISGTKLYSELIEGFENGIPEDWTLIAHTNVQGYTWTTQAGDSNSSAPIAPHNGSANALAPYIGESGSASLITPYMNLSEMDFAAIEFWLLNRRWSSDIDTLGVYYRMYGEEDWQQLFYTDQNHETWTRVRMRLPEEVLAGSFQIKFVSYVRHGFGIGLDDIHVFGMTSDQHFSVSYDANGGGGIMTDGNSYMFADDAVLMGNKFTPPEGYFFAGWNTKADGSGVTYFAGDLYVVLDSVTLYAQWLRIQQGFDLDCEKDLPKGWMVESTTTGFNWNHVGTVMQTSSNGEDGESWLISPSVNLAQKDGAKLVFSLFGSGNTEFNMNETEFKVYYRVNGRDWEEIYFSRKYPLEPYEYMIDLPERALADDVQIGFRSVEHGDRITRLSYVRLAGFLTVSELTEDFENGIPSNWTVIADEDKPLYTWKTISGDGNVNPPIAPHGGEANAMVLHTSSGCTSWLLTPYLSFSGELDVVLKFWFLNRAWSGDIDELVVYYRTMKDGDWQTLADETSAHETWTTKDFVIPKERTEYPIQIAFQAIDRYGFGVGLDDIRIFEFDSSIGYTVTYDANGGSGTMVDENTYTFMSEACVKKNTFTAPENKSFLCWNTEADGSGTDYHYNDLITMTGNVTLYAQWISYPDSFDVAFGLHLPENWSIETTNDAYMWFGEENDFAACSNGKEGTTWLISPYLDLSRGTSAVLSFTLCYCADFERLRNFSVCYRVSDGEWMDLGFTPKVEYNYVMYYDIYLPKELMKDEIQIAFKAISEGVQGVYLYDASLVTYNEAAIHGVIIPSDVEHGTILPMPCFDLVGGKMNMKVIPDPGYGIGELALTCNGIPVAYELDGDYLSYTMPD